MVISRSQFYVLVLLNCVKYKAIELLFLHTVLNLLKALAFQESSCVSCDIEKYLNIMFNSLLIQCLY